MVLAWFRRRSWFVCKLALLWALMAALSGFGGFAQPVTPYLEPQSVGPVTNLGATVDGQPPGSVQLTWTAAENAQVHFVVYIKATDAASGNFGAVQMASFSGTEAVIHGLEGGTPYAFIALGMRWNWIEYGTIWGDWSQMGFRHTNRASAFATSISVTADRTESRRTGFKLDRRPRRRTRNSSGDLVARPERAGSFCGLHQVA